MSWGTVELMKSWQVDSKGPNTEQSPRRSCSGIISGSSRSMCCIDRVRIPYTNNGLLGLVGLEEGLDLTHGPVANGALDAADDSLGGAADRGGRGDGDEAAQECDEEGGGGHREGWV